MKPASDPRSILDVLLGNSSAPLQLPGDAVERARPLAQQPAEADPQAVQALPEPLALAIVEAAVRAKALPLVDALSSASNKALAKAAKKALYQLKSQGVAVPEKKTAASTAAPAPAADEVLPSLVSAITGNGERALIIGRPVRGRVETLQLVIADEHGVVHLGLNEISRGMYRKMLKDARRPGAPSAVEIPFDEARELLAEGIGLNVRTKTPYPAGLDAALRHLDITAWEKPRELPAPEEGDAALAVNSGALHDQAEISQWLPPVDELRAFAQKAQEIAVSPLYLDEDQRADQLRRTIQSMAETFFDERVRQLYARRLWHMAALFERTDRAEVARLARAEARRLFHAAPGLFSPFATRLFEKVLALSGPMPQRPAMPMPPGALAGTGAASSTAGSGAERGAEQPPAEKRSPGGLILP